MMHMTEKIYQKLLEIGCYFCKLMCIKFFDKTLYIYMYSLLL